MDERRVVQTARFVYQVTVEARLEKPVCHLAKCDQTKECHIEKCRQGDDCPSRNENGMLNIDECSKESCELRERKFESCLGNLRHLNINVQPLEINTPLVPAKEDGKILSFFDEVEYLRKYLPEYIEQTIRLLDHESLLKENDCRWVNKAARESSIRLLIIGKYIKALRQRLGATKGNKTQYVSQQEKAEIKEKYLQRCAELETKEELSVENLANSFFENKANPAQTMRRELKKIELTNQGIIDEYKWNKNVE